MLPGWIMPCKCGTFVPAVPGTVRARWARRAKRAEAAAKSTSWWPLSLLKSNMLFVSFCV